MIRRTLSIALVSALAALSAPTSAAAAWWTANYAPVYRTTAVAPNYAYYAPPTTAYYAPTTAAYAPTVAAYAPATAYYAPRTVAAYPQTANYGAQTAYYGAQTAYAPVASACTRQVCSYVPQTSYQAMYRAVPVTTYHPVTTVDHYSGSSWTGYRPVTQTVQQAYYVPVTSYRPVCSTVSIAMSPVCAAPACTACAAPATTATYLAPPVVAAPVAAPPAASCCGGSTPLPAGQPVQPIPQGPINGPGIPAPAIDPSAPIPNSNGQGLSSEQQSRETARPTYSPPYSPPYSPQSNQPYTRPVETKAQPTFVLPRNEAPRDKVAVGGYGAQAVYSPASWAPSTSSNPTPTKSATGVDTSGWKAAD